MIFWIFLILFVNAIGAFAYSAATSADPGTIWAMLVSNYMFFLGISQAGIVFSVIMRVTKSKWGAHYSRIGELITISFMPVVVITFLVIYIWGKGHLFYWINPEVLAGSGHHIPEHISPWLSRGLFFWKNILAMFGFYVLSIIYLQLARREEKGLECDCVCGIQLKTVLQWLGAFICVFFAFGNTFIAWDFAMMNIPHWESTIFPAYVWSGNLFAGFGAIYIVARLLVPNAPGKPLATKYVEGMSVLIMGFVLLWIYMFFSQHIVFWYADIPEHMGPIFGPRKGAFKGVYWLMMFASFFVPFTFLIFQRVKHCQSAIYVVSLIVLTGIWLDRYLMVIPTYNDGSGPVLWTYTGLALLLGGASAIFFSVMLFTKLFPKVTLKPHH